MGSLTVKLLGSPQHRRAVLQHTAQGRGANVGCDGMGDMDGGREPDPDRSRGHGGHGRSGFAGRVAVVPSRISTLACLTFFHPSSSSDHLSTLTCQRPTHQTRLSVDDSALQAPKLRPCLPAPWERMKGGGRWTNAPSRVGRPGRLGIERARLGGGGSGKKPGCLSMSTIHHDTTRHAQNPVQNTDDAYCRRRQDGCTPWLPRYVGFISVRLCYDATCLLFVRVLDDFWRGSMGAATNSVQSMPVDGIAMDQASPSRVPPIGKLHARASPDSV